MKNNFSYFMPTNILYGNDGINVIDDHIKNRRTLLITTQGAVNRGLLGRLEENTCSIEHVIAAISSHPDLNDLKDLYNTIEHDKIELILAVGGGSVLDAAKFFSLYQTDNIGCGFIEKMLKEKNTEKVNSQHIPVISIPTTSGTGSEITPWATVWDRRFKKKYSLHLKNLFPETAIYDPKLTLSVPYEITLQTALDTLSHALESIWNKNASPVTVNYAVQSIRLTMEFLPNLLKNLDNVFYRNKIMMATMFAGLAFSNTQTAIAHAVSYYITMHKELEHGIACSFTLPFFIDKIIGKYEYIDAALNEAFGELSSQRLRRMYDDLNISTQFSDYGIDSEELEIVKQSLKTTQRASNSLVDF